MKKSVQAVLAALLLPGAVSLKAVAPEGLFAEIDEIAQDLGKYSGLRPLRKIEYAQIGKQQVQAFLEQRVKESVKPEEIRAEELTLKKFGLAPQDFDLRRTTIDLLTEQAAAFYDFRKKKLFVIDSGSDLIQHSALVHEIAHALADQHFHLQKFIDTAKESDDGSLARMAVMEGQATWLTAEYMSRRTGQSLRDSPALVKMWSRAAVAEGQYPVFDRAPLYLRETLLFPYTQGMLFQHAAVEKLGLAAFAEVFRRPPENTQQVLHPDKYLARWKAAEPKPPSLSSERGYRTLAEGTMGELDHAILLRQYGGEQEAASLAAAWRGGRYRLLENKKGGRLVLQYASEWENDDAARRFFFFYRRVLERKWKRFEPASEASASVAGRGDDGYFVLECDGNRVRSVEGMESPGDARMPMAEGRSAALFAGPQPALVAIH